MSSDLFVILGFVAALLIGGVAIYNKVQERRYRRRAEETLHQRHDDVLLAEETASGRERDGRIEPQMEAGEITVGREEGEEAAESEGEPQRELDRPWVTTLPEVPVPEPWGSSQGMAARSNAEENADAPATDLRKTVPPGGLDEFRASKGKLYEPPAEPRKTAPPGSLDEVRTGKGKLYEPPSEPRKSIPPGSLRDASPNSRPPSVERPSIPSGRETRASLSPTHPSIPPGSLSRGGRERQAPRPAVKDFDPPHASLDYVVRLDLETSRPASAFTQLVAQARSLSKPVRFAGLNAVSGDWEEMHANRTYQQVSAGLQLADRSGPASDTDISRFSEILRRGAVGLKARAQCPPLHQALASAIELDQFCADVDVTIGLNIIARRSEPFAASRLAQLAEAIGFKLASNGNFEFTTEDGSAVFSLCDQDGAAFSGDRIDVMSSRGVTLLLDVPRVAEGVPAFDAMVAVANDLCEPLGGVLVDDNGKPLNERGIENIRAQLRDIYDKMQARQISAGSPRARRLFS